MKYRTITRYFPVAILALALTACGGSGGGNADPFAGGSGGAGITITITAPATADTMETPDPSVILEGTADSVNGIASVSWSSDRGGAGDASGTSVWKTGGINLKSGKNKITITARDRHGASATRTVTIMRESAGSGSVTLGWMAPSTREDGSALTNLAGYYIRYGRMSGIYDYVIDIDNPGTLSYVVEGLKPGTWYFVASAYDSDGLESNYSNEVKLRVD
jgi:hypothetical protein